MAALLALSLASSIALVPSAASQLPARTVQVRHSPVLALAPLPTLPTIAAVCTLPTTLGYWKSEYGVSYAYGGAMAAMGALVLRAAPTRLAACHAAALLVYGVRLNLFLLWRELSVERFREFREKVEERAVAAGSRLKRTPFVLSCSVLYACMAAPLLITARATSPTRAQVVLVATAWFGLLLAALGDAYKSYVKARQGAEALVITGPFRFFRHPNYTGEQILWTANMLAGFVAAASSGMSGVRAAAGALVASVVGWAGIMYVLAQATTNLEKKQAERFEAFKAWRQGSWGGFSLKLPKAA